MWITIDTENTDEQGRGRVVGTSPIRPQPREGDRYIVKEWFGSEPAVYEAISGDGDYDPTVDDPDYPDSVQTGIDFDELSGMLVGEIAWLDQAIPQIDSMDLPGLRVVLKRLAQENRYTLKAWRYVARGLRGSE